jgi:anti-sigma factor RsiW
MEAPSQQELEATRALRAAVGVRDARDAAAERRASALKEHDRAVPVHVTRADHARSVRDLHAAIDRAERGDMDDAADYAAENAAARRRESFETWLAVGLAFAVVIAIAVFMTVWG